jgi:hypothetical protein
VPEIVGSAVLTGEMPSAARARTCPTTFKSTRVSATTANAAAINERNDPLTRLPSGEMLGAGPGARPTRGHANGTL